MKLSAKGEYACLATLELARHYGGREAVQAHKIAGKHQIPEPYLVQILLQLLKAGVVGSRRGSQGGYFLARPPSEITLGEVVRIVEGSIAPSKCLEKDRLPQAGAPCAFRDIWERVEQAISSIIDNITFEDIRRQSKDLGCRTAAAPATTT